MHGFVSFALLFAAFLVSLPGAFAQPVSSAGSAPSAASAQKPFTVAFVRDAASAEINAHTDLIKQEIISVAGTRYAPSFPSALVFDGNWNLDSIAANLDRAQSDPSVDAIILVGDRSLFVAASAKRLLSKPSFGALLTSPGLLPASLPENKTRLTLVTASQSFEALAVRLRSLSPTTQSSPLYVLTNYADSPSPASGCEALAKIIGAPVTLITFKDSAEATLAAIPADASRVLCMPSLRLDRAARAVLFKGLAARRIAVFSFSGQRDVEEGALAAFLPDTELMLARSLAVRLDQVATGNTADTLTSQIPVQARFFLNESVARTIGLSISYEDLNAATIVSRVGEAEQGEPLTISQAVLRALEGSFALKIKAESSIQAKESQRMAAGALGPRVAATYRHQQVDRDRAEFAGVVLPETNVRAGLVLEQALLDDEAFSRHKAAREAYRAASEQEKSARLEVVERALLSYIDALSAQALLSISTENLSRTEQHLALARLRHQAGTAGPEETLRFESAAAQQRGEMAAAKARFSRAIVALNRACHLPPDARWKLEDVDLDSPAFRYSSRTVASRLRNREESERFLSWCTSYALTHSPDLGTLERQLAAQRIVVGQQSRRNYMPRVALSAQLDRVVDMELGGPTLIEQLVRRGMLPMPAHLPDRTEWAFAVTAQLPLFTSGTLSADLRRSRSALRQLEFAQADARDAIAARARASFFALTGSFPNIELSAVAHGHAARNLEISREKYERGTVSVVTLLDAQTNAHDAREGAVLAQYRFLSDLVAFHRALGWHELLSTKEEMESLTQEIDQALRSTSQVATQK